jgi:DNA-binding MarR family transcriptional regulator
MTLGYVRALPWQGKSVKLSPLEVSILRLLPVSGGVSAAEIGLQVDRDEREVDRLLRRLQGVGMVTRLCRRGSRVWSRRSPQRGAVRVRVEEDLASQA